MLGELRCPLDHLEPGRHLGVEHSQWVRGQHLGEVVAELVDVGLEVVDEPGHVVGPAGVVAHRVQLQANAAEADRGEEPERQVDHLDVEIRVGCADHLDSELMVLAIAALLWTFVAEARRGVEDLPRLGRTVLDEGTHHRGRAFGAQRQAPPALVGELVHLLGHDVGRLADPLKNLDVLERRRDQQAVAEGRGSLRERTHNRLEAVGLRWDDVVSALGRAKHLTWVRPVGRHGGRAYRRPA